MCRAVSPAAFLALAFKASEEKRIQYSILEEYRSHLKKQRTTATGVPYDVAWNHDSYNFTMGFYSPVFKEFDSGIECDRKNLEHFYDTLIADIPKDDRSRLQHSFKVYSEGSGNSKQRPNHVE